MRSWRGRQTTEGFLALLGDPSVGNTSESDSAGITPSFLFSQLNAANMDEESESDFDLHTPHTRSIFRDLSSKVKDMEALYGQHLTDGAPADASEFVPSAEAVEAAQKLHEAIDFFKSEMQLSFDKYTEYANASGSERGFLEQVQKILQAFEAPVVDTPELHSSAQTITASLVQLTDSMQNKRTEALRLRNFHWTQFAGLRNMCRTISEVQSDMVCSLCYQREIEVALGCGHVMCRQCSARITSCPSCRSIIHSRTKLFL